MTGNPPKISKATQAKRKQLVGIYQRAQARLEKQLASAALTDFAKFRIQEQLVQVNAIVAQLNADVKSAAPAMLNGYYKYGADLGNIALEAQGIATTALNLGNRIHTSAIQAVAEQMALDLAKANSSMKETATRILRETQQSLIQEKQINKIIAEGLATGETRRETSKRLKAELADKLNGGRFVKAGRGSFTPEYYAELVTRTRTREAVTQGAITRSLEFGVTLFQVSIHDNPCPQCAQYQGKVYSIVPDDSGFPPLEARPPFHPNCYAPDTKVCAPDLVAGYSMEYSGPMIAVTMESGRNFKVTPNHPILGYERFLRASQIEAGDTLIAWSAFGDRATIRDTVEKRCEFLSTHYSNPGSFHGDGEFVTTRPDIRIRKKTDPVDFESFCTLQSALGHPADRFSEGHVNVREIRARLASGHSEITHDRVASVETVEYTGPVYDLETECGLYCAEGIIVSNCRHVLLGYVPVPGREDRHEALKALSNSNEPIAGGLPGYQEAVAQARKTGGLKKKQIGDEGRTVATPAPAGPTGEEVRKRIFEVAEKNDGSLSAIGLDLMKVYPGNPSEARTSAPLKFKATASLPKTKAEEKFNAGIDVFFRMVSEKSLPQSAFKPSFHSQKQRRASYSFAKEQVNLQHSDEQRIIVHEMGHWLEHKNPRIMVAANAFLEARTKGETAQSLKKLTGNRGYRASEVARKDRFKEPYMGKIYPSLNAQQLQAYGYPSGAVLRPTEIVSMGLESMFANPWAFAKDDPEYFDFVWDVIMSGKEYP